MMQLAEIEKFGMYVKKNILNLRLGTTQTRYDRGYFFFVHIKILVPFGIYMDQNMQIIPLTPVKVYIFFLSTVIFW